MSLFNPNIDRPLFNKSNKLFGKGNSPVKNSLFNNMKHNKDQFSKNGNKFSLFNKISNKLSGGEQTEVSGFTLLIVVIISFVIVIAVYYFAMRDPEASKLKKECKSACKQIHKQCNNYCDTDFVDDWRKLQNGLQNPPIESQDQYPPVQQPTEQPVQQQPAQEKPVQQPQQLPPEFAPAPPGVSPEDWVKIRNRKDDDKGGKEGFLRSKFAAVYKDSGAINCVNDWSTLKTAYDNINNGIVGLSKTIGAKRKPLSKRKEGYEATEDKDTKTTTSAEGASKKCERDFMSKLYRKGPLSGAAIEKCLDCPSVEPVNGFSNGNTRVNGYYPMSNEACIDISKCSKTKGIEPFTKLDNVIIDDKGYSNSEAYIPTNCNTPMCSNSRLTGSAMNCSALVGAFRKFDTDPNFFKSPAPFPPKLNYLKGEPAKLKYCSHPDF